MWPVVTAGHIRFKLLRLLSDFSSIWGFVVSASRHCSQWLIETESECFAAEETDCRHKLNTRRCKSNCLNQFWTRRLFADFWSHGFGFTGCTIGPASYEAISVLCQQSRNWSLLASSPFHKGYTPLLTDSVTVGKIGVFHWLESVTTRCLQQMPHQ